MNKTDIYRFLSNEERENLYTQADKLKADLTFFEMYLARNKISNFSFEIIPVLSFQSGNLMKKLYMDSYTYLRDKFHEMLFEIEIVKKLAWQLSEQGEVKYSEPDIKDIYKYFKDLHEVDLVEYIGDFIGCSHTTEAACKKLKEVIR